ncbi:MAG: TonB-dependent receptor [Prevotellaceae bacterium]|nr:TonB-dependent receptor [Prevotellaceae bacterium]
MKKIVFIVTMMCCVAVSAHEEPADSVMNVSLKGVEVVSSPKEIGSMRQQPASVTLIDQSEIERQHITSIKGVAAVAPNFFMPDYGSRLTSAIYIRGIGSRINTPAVGLYVDNIPYVDKSAFDFRFFDIERIDVLRGPQSTLYGRNTMGGLVKVYTKNPMSYQGTDMRLGFATRDNHRTAAVTHYHRVSDKFAFSAGGYYEGGNGFFKNDIKGHEIDDVQAGGGRMRAIFMPNRKLKFDATINYDYSDEGAYPYYYKENIGGGMDDLLGKISANHEGRYRRGLFNAGVNTEYKAERVTLTSVTGYQNLNDRMKIDQDFMQPDYYCMLQKQKSDVISEEVTLKNSKPKTWNWIVGGSAFYQWITTDAPVTFYKDGIQSLIEDNINSIFAGIKQTYPNMPNMALKVVDDEFTNSSSLKTPLLSLALFHQSSFNLGNWNITAGLRLDYEKMKLDYRSQSLINYDFTISMPPMMNMAIPGMKANPVLEGKKDKDYVQLLPRLAVKYTFNNDVNPSFAYASVSRGFRSGGYNIQLISDLVQGEMRGQMMDSINVASHGMMERYVDIESLKTHADIDNVVYKPEYSWNYEAGLHLSKGIFNAQLALFYSKIYDQQISRFVSSGLGRVMINAGESESLGLEVAFNAGEYFSIAYGYTQAKFNDYDDGTNNYTGNYVPFVPQHTLNVKADYPVEWGIGGRKNERVRMAVGVDFTAAGRIYWTEANNASQNFYGTLGAHVAFDFRHVGVNIWGKNLTDSDYDTFYFESLGHGLAQHGKPIQFGVDVKLSF